MQAQRSASEIEAFLHQRLETKVAVSLGRSRTQPVRASHQQGLWSLRLHGMFATAPEVILDDLARWLGAGRRARKACERLDRWIDDALAELPARAPRTLVLRPVGLCYDLGAMATSIIASDFADGFPSTTLPHLSWGRRSRSSSRRSLRLGSFSPADHLIRLHPVLDQAGVPEWFVRFVLFHELLHTVHPPIQGSNGRWIHHGASFRRREQAHPDFERATRWERRNLSALIRSARSGQPLPRPEALRDQGPQL